MEHVAWRITNKVREKDRHVQFKLKLAPWLSGDELTWCAHEQ